ncbi:MAG: hypothetical protein GY795_31240 [Desulfobacterales bacterium]|nr:hypothetical protein [Desulfobacterales bacterium]
MEYWESFEKLKIKMGNDYLKDREYLLHSIPDIKERVQSYQDDSNWQNRILAGILAGWSDHDKLYSKVLADLDAVDLERELQTVTGISGVWNKFALTAQNEYKSDILPLCWESLMKFHNEWPEWKLITFMRMIVAVPDEKSIYPLISLIENTSNSRLQQSAGRSLARLPKQDVKKQVEQALKRHKQDDITILFQDVLLWIKE